VDSNDVRASFTNYGWSVDVSAPGVNILSTVIDGDSPKWVSGAYARMSGTSMATPAAAGVAALIKSQFPTHSAADVGAQLLTSADDIGADNPGYEANLGAGRVDAFGAVGALLGPAVIAAKTEGSDRGAFGDLQISVKFSHAMNAASVLNAANYGLLWAGPDGLFDTGDDAPVNLTMATTAYEAFPGQGVQLLAPGAPDGNCRFTASSNIQSAAGQPLTAFVRDLAWVKPRWTSEMVLAGVGGGYPVGLAYDGGGNPTIAFSDDLDKNGSVDTVRFARWDGTAWEFETIASGYGAGLSLAYDRGGNPSVSFFTDGNLKFARRSGSSWTIVNVDSNLSLCDTSLAYDPAGNPSISYRAIEGKGRTASSNLKLARWNGSSWVTQVVQAGAGARYDSLAYGPDGNPSIAYSDDLDRDNSIDTLKMARWNGSSWQIQVIETGAVGYGVFASLAYDPVDHNPSVAHGGGGDPPYGRFAHWYGSAWQASCFNPEPYAGAYCRLVYDALGVPFISHSAYGDTILVTRWNGTAWLTETADCVYIIWSPPSIAINPLNNTPSVAYCERTSAGQYNLKFAQRAS
jgi:hypothetical protein